MKTFFSNRTVDKGEMKRLIKWVLLNYGTEKTTRLIDQLKTMGFHYATHAGISLGIDDLSIPPIKSAFLQNAENDIYENDLRLKRGQITSVQRLEKALDIWNTTNDTLKTEVVKYFRSTDIFNPVYMMAFSGARGNISQVRQLVGMRGLMADPQGQILDFPIRRNFREGLTVTEYMISCYGARKGLVDTALRTASSGYLTRRLVDVAQSVIIQQVDCQTTQGLRIVPNPKQIDSQLIGRVLFENVIDVETGRIIGYKNQDISPALALKLVKQPTLTIRSPLTCNFHAVCQLCYGWNLAQQKLVQLGEAVGVLAAQSIGEPGTQLTMRTFHTGGVFSGEATEKVYAPQGGTLFYRKKVRGRKVLSKYGEIAFLTFEPLQVKIKNSVESSVLEFPAFTLLYTSPGQHILAHQSLAELSRIETKQKFEQFDLSGENLQKEFLSNRSGQIFVPQFQNSLKAPKSKILKPTLNYSEMWLLAGTLIQSNLLVQGDTLKNLLHPIRGEGEPQLESEKNSLSAFYNLNCSMLELKINLLNKVTLKDRLILKQFQLGQHRHLYPEHLNFLRSYYLELNKIAQTKLASKQCLVGSKFDKTLGITPKNLVFKQVQVKQKLPMNNFKLCRVMKEQYSISCLKPVLNSSLVSLVGLVSTKVNPLTSIFVNNLFLQNGLIGEPERLLQLHNFATSTRKKSNFFPNPTNLTIQSFKPAFVNGKLMPVKAHYTSVNAVTKTVDKSFSTFSDFGEVRATSCVVTSEDQSAFKLNVSDLSLKLGDYARIEDQLTKQTRIPVSGQLNFINNEYVVVRSVQPYLIVPGSKLMVQHGSLVQANTVLGTLVTSESTAGDIVQGLPKVDELLEAREPQHKILSSMHAKLSTLFSQYGKIYGLREGCELSFQKIRQFLVQEVQEVYQSQGVYIGDKHVEIIVRQMTTHVVVVDPGKTGLLPGDIVDIRRIGQLEHNGFFAGVKYRPILLGITRAALMAESFISAASFQETKRVLSKAALEGQIDWLTGLKENVILGRLIPAGTGLY
jgi:hypothetical protein